MSTLREQLRELFDYRDGQLFYRNTTTFHVAGDAVEGARPDGRQELWFNGRLHLVHRLIYLWHQGELPDIIDHIDRDFTNNRISNLRAVSKSENNHNSTLVRSSTGFRGVIYAPHVKLYRARIFINKVRHEIGYFPTAEEAATAYIDYKKANCPYVSNSN